MKVFGSMIGAGFHFGGDILNKMSTAGNRHYLASPADPEYGLVKCHHFPEKSQLECITLRLDFTAGFMLFLAVSCGIHIVAAGEQKGIKLQCNLPDQSGLRFGDGQKNGEYIVIEFFGCGQQIVRIPGTDKMHSLSDGCGHGNDFHGNLRRNDYLLLLYDESAVFARKKTHIHAPIFMFFRIYPL